LFFENFNLIFICFGLCELLQAQAYNWLMVDGFMLGCLTGLWEWFFLLQWTEDEVPLYSVPPMFLPSQSFWLCVLLLQDD
jgi:hypothetical protein